MEVELFAVYLKYIVIIWKCKVSEP